MADDHNQRAYRAADASARGTGAGSSSSGATSGNDPLAELARLIGQTDPFAEYGRNNGGHHAAPAAGGQPGSSWPGETPGYAAPPAASPNQTSYADQAAYADQAPYPEQAAYPDQPYGNGRFGGRQAYGSPTAPAAPSELYPVDAHAPGYASAGGYPAAYANGQAPGYDDAFPPSQEPLHDIHQQFGPAPSDDYYDDVAPSRRRISVMAIAGVFALAVIGTAGALGYRAVFGPSSAPATPPVIKAEATPSKVVPATASKEPGKATDRVGNGPIERLLSREEQPVPVTTTPNQPSGNAAFPSNGGAPAMGSGVVGEPKKIRTIPIRPDQADGGAGMNTVPEPSPGQPPVRVVNAAPVTEVPARVAPAAPARPPAPQAVPAAPQAAPVQQTAPPSNAPLSLNPNAAPARPARVAAQTPAAPVATASTGGGGYSVQVSAQRSEAEAQSAFQSLQGRYPSQLGGRSPFIKRVDLGDKGVFYRAMVVVGSSGEASELCSSLKAAGGSCIVQRN